MYAEILVRRRCRGTASESDDISIGAREEVLIKYLFLQYYIRVMIRPPLSISGRVPNYDCELLIELTTDDYDSAERDIAESGGLQTPALSCLEELTRLASRV